MPQATIITLNDASEGAVPFTPSKVSDLEATYFGPGTTLAGRKSLQIRRREASGNTAGRAEYILRVPIEVAADNVTSVHHQSQITITGVSAPASSEAERADLWAMAESLFTDVSAKAAFVKGEGVY